MVNGTASLFFGWLLIEPEQKNYIDSTTDFMTCDASQTKGNVLVAIVDYDS